MSENLETLKYYEGWLQVQEGKGILSKGYKDRWCVLKGQVIGEQAITALFFRFKSNQNLDQCMEFQELNLPNDRIALLKKDGNDHRKCDFTLKLGENKIQLRAENDLEREKWIYALCDLAAEGRRPGELPGMHNDIRSKYDRKQGSLISSKSFGANDSSRRNRARPKPPLQRCLTSPTGIASSASDDAVATAKSVNLHERASVSDVDWYFTGITRIAAESLLVDKPVGTYLLRDSESSKKPDHYTLTYRGQHKICNHLIIPSPDGTGYIFDNSTIEETFNSPIDAVEFFMENKHSITPQPIKVFQDEELVAEEEEEYLKMHYSDSSLRFNNNIKQPRAQSQSVMNKKVSQSSIGYNIDATLPPTPEAVWDDPFTSSINRNHSVSQNPSLTSIRQNSLSSSNILSTGQYKEGLRRPSFPDDANPGVFDVNLQKSPNRLVSQSSTNEPYVNSVVIDNFQRQKDNASISAPPLPPRANRRQASITADPAYVNVPAGGVGNLHNM